MRLRLVTIVLVVIAILAVAGSVVASRWTPTVPVGAASMVLARATLSGDVLPDPGPEADLEQVPRTPAGQECLDRISHPAGWLDLCWEAYRTPDGDPAKDYYILRVYGSLSGSGTGVRWSTVRADLVGQWGQPADGVFFGWPDGTFEGPCQEVQLPLWVGFTNGSDDVCGRTTGAFVSGWGHQVTWLCVGCMFADRSNRAVIMYEEVAVVEGGVPAWDIGADFGD
jgi:hypothetical protein